MYFGSIHYLVFTYVTGFTLSHFHIWNDVQSSKTYNPKTDWQLRTHALLEQQLTTRKLLGSQIQTRKSIFLQLKLLQLTDSLLPGSHFRIIKVFNNFFIINIKTYELLKIIK